MAALPDVSEWREGYEEDLTIINDCLCVSCGGGNGRTTFLATKVPFFREIMVTNLKCEDCGFHNSEVSFGGEIQEKGEILTLTVTGPEALNRQIIKADSCSLFIPKLDFEIPRTTQKGNVSTLEGILRTAARNLEAQQPDRLKLGDVDNFHRCKTVIDSLRRFAGERDSDAEEEPASTSTDESIFPFDVVLDDLAGNSFIENPLAPAPDPHLKAEKYIRTATQDMALGLQPSATAVKAGTIDNNNPAHKNDANKAKGTHTIESDMDIKLGGMGRQEVLKFPTNCSSCHRPAETDMCVVDIPHFKEVIIMCMVCDSCGYKSNEIKGGGGIPKYGTKITLTITSPDDLAREVLKSDTAGIAIPELDLVLDEGGLDGLYTSVEGLLKKMHDRLKEANPFGSGDSAAKQHLTNDGGEFSVPSTNHTRYIEFLSKLNDMAEGNKLPFTLEISDPLSNSFIGPVPRDAVALSLQAEKDGNNKCYDLYVDAGMEIDEYERTNDQNEYLGLNDMKTEGYATNGDGSVSYGTDAMEDVPDRIRRLDIRGPDHPHEVGKAPVEGDTTVMGANSVNHAVPSMGQRGKAASAVSAPALISSTTTTTTHPASEMRNVLRTAIRDAESKDSTFISNDSYSGSLEGMVYKDGVKGVGYYKDTPLTDLCKDFN